MPTKVVWISDFPLRGSSFGSVTYDLLTRMPKDYFFEVLSLGYEGMPLKIAENIRVFELKKTYQLKYYFKKLKPDVTVVFHSFWLLDSMMSEIETLTGKRILYIPCEGEDIPFGYRKHFEHFDTVITPSEFSRRIMKKSGIEAKVVPHGVDTTFFTPPKPSSWHEFRFGYLGLNDIRKQVPRVMEAYSRLHQGILVIAAENEGHYNLLQLSKQYGIAPIFIEAKLNGLTMNREAIRDLMQSLDVYIAPASECLGPETQITTRRGRVPIAEIQIGDEVITSGGWRRVEKIMTGQNSKPAVKIKTRLLQEEGDFTKDHLLLGAKKTSLHGQEKAGIIRYLKAGDLRRGDFIAMKPLETSKQVVIFPQEYVKKSLGKNQYCSFPYKREKKLPEKLKVDKDFAAFLGYYLSEGCLSNKNGLILSNTRKEILEEMEALGRKIFRIIPRRNLIKKEGYADATNLCFQSVQLVRLFRTLFGEGANKKRIPGEFLDLDREILASLLRTYIKGDGCFCSRGNRKAIRISTTSETLRDELKLILLKIGVVPSCSKRTFRNKNWNSEYTIAINGPQVRILGYKGKEKEKHAMFLKKDGYFLIPIKSVSETNMKKRFDIQVRGIHNFTSIGITHNSFGIPGLEAQACGVPVIASSHGAAPEVLGNGGVYCGISDYLETTVGKIGLISTADLYRKMRFLIQVKTAYEKTKIKALENAKKWPWENGVKKMTEVLEK